MTAFVGCDPGMSGAIAVYWPADGQLVVHDMPTHEINGKRRIDLYQLTQLLEGVHHLTSARAVVENVGAMPGQSPNSMFSFGFACGALQAAVAASLMPMTLVVPQVWKKVYGLKGGKEFKDLSRAAASRVFPKHAGLWARKKDDGRAEAALLAHYGSKLQ